MFLLDIYNKINTRHLHNIASTNVYCTVNISVNIEITVF